MALLSLEQVSKTYYRGGRHRIPVLRDVTFEIDEAELAALVGDPMSGKTTLLRIAAGLEAPDTGRVSLAGDALPVTTDLDPRLALVARTAPPRETMGMPVLDLLAVPLLDRMAWREARRRVTHALTALEIEDLSRAVWSELSDVERMLVRIAQATVRRPVALLVDDPMPGLGLGHVEVVLSCLRQAAVDGCAVLMTAGELADATQADTVLTLSAGSLVRTSLGETHGRVLDFPAGRGA